MADGMHACVHCMESGKYTASAVRIPMHDQKPSKCSDRRARDLLVRPRLSQIWRSSTMHVGIADEPVIAWHTRQLLHQQKSHQRRRVL
jgi:hypothetical protein